MRGAWLHMPPASLLDTLLLANQTVPSPAPLGTERARNRPPPTTKARSTSCSTAPPWPSIRAEADEQYQLMSAALLV